MGNFSCVLGAFLPSLFPFRQFLRAFSTGTSRGQSDLPGVNAALSISSSPQQQMEMLTADLPQPKIGLASSASDGRESK